MSKRSLELTFKQRRFVDLFLGEANGNASKAALLAGYSPSCAMQTGQKLLHHPRVRAEIEGRLRKLAMGSEEVLARLSDQARGIGEYVLVEDGNIRIEFERMRTEGKLHLLHSIKDTSAGRNYEFYDAQAALQLLARYHKLLTDKHEVSGPGGGPVSVRFDYDELRRMDPNELVRLHRETLGDPE